MIIKLFGQLADITHTSSLEIVDVSDTKELIEALQSKFPLLKNTKYAVAVNRNIIQSDITLNHDSEIALLPPFSGG